MAWRWRKSIGLGGGARTTISPNGIGVSWGFAGFRFGRSPNGSRWISYTIPLTGISFFRYINQRASATSPNSKASSQALTAAVITQPPVSTQSTPLTANQRVLEKIKDTKS
jgi:hypothetical protein